MPQSQDGCLNCGRREDEVPVLDWRYQGRALHICADCLPALLHHREDVLGKWRPEKKDEGAI